MLFGIMKICFSSLGVNLLNLVQKEGKEISISSTILHVQLNSNPLSKPSLILQSPYSIP